MSKVESRFMSSPLTPLRRRGELKPTNSAGFSSDECSFSPSPSERGLGGEERSNLFIYSII
jgi:hypothetical protein